MVYVVRVSGYTRSDHVREERGSFRAPGQVTCVTRMGMEPAAPRKPDCTTVASRRYQNPN
jgi:hypothetical protein